MTQELVMDATAYDLSQQTAEIMRRYNDVFQCHDPSALAELVAEDCVIENTVPAPHGARFAGQAACVFVAGDRATIRWRYFMADGNSLRGVNLMRVADGRIVEAMGYVKG
ncbi:MULTISPECIES: nuclear transport factor 2 family protein [unclassified Mesorhizobium]|uniref:nuclear transport factor 2 family protein n=1 Tax=unclassified Mesorhizobium TaxID=325217 RepID=UPI000FCA4780|nr:MULTISPECIES: nuclear transport factor 2 family protein [unclassified Mesorhizobium]RUU57195.1 nuclear transport factor 2 family protein [Mesorhizobium sp. M7A.T.Ca.TU.009.01.1.1]RUU89580.1 nuclear transport factor 2 family protein [Mesorhizobium sp. M7A.T.Ca.TU.009.01.1.2]RUT83989.1 nuclear transport factor 2 family protein [Mesorhizobium sp. M7A.T.Ca.US.000.02.2.1]RUT85010.1 nuclear transport factor 2 family protein [Mesorhizobium sp. M7A.T.Ca.US.000.02.1.1]RUU04292.1 nuclear transport fa